MTNAAIIMSCVCRLAPLLEGRRSKVPRIRGIRKCVVEMLGARNLVVEKVRWSHPVSIFEGSFRIDFRSCTLDDSAQNVIISSVHTSTKETVRIEEDGKALHYVDLRWYFLRASTKIQVQVTLTIAGLPSLD